MFKILSDTVTAVGGKAKEMVVGARSALGLADDPFLQAGADGTMMGNAASSDDLFAHAAAMREENALRAITGFGYQLSYAHHKHREAHDRPYFFQSPLGAPFPSYHSNPMPNFPARWTQIDNIKDPVENLTAPRIRLAPRELTDEKREVLERMRFTASAEPQQPSRIEELNLGYQALGDPYQYEAFVTFMDLNRNVKILNLTDNELEDITDLNLENVVRLHLGNNNFVSLEALPPLPNCEELFMTENFLSGFQGIKKENFPKLRILNVQHNPLALMPSYRRKLKTAIPTLQWVDGMCVADMDISFLANLMATD